MVVKTNKEMRPRDFRDFYETPIGLIRAALPLLERWNSGLSKRKLLRVLDPGSGRGRWGAEVRRLYPKAEIVGVDCNFKEPDDSQYDLWVDGSFLDRSVYDQLGPASFDLVVGNPPYKFAEEFVRRAIEMLKPGGLMVLLLRLEFEASQGRGEGLHREFPFCAKYTLSRRVSFSYDGKTDSYDYAMFVWDTSWPLPVGEYKGGWLDWDYVLPDDRIKPLEYPIEFGQLPLFEA